MNRSSLLKIVIGVQTTIVSLLGFLKARSYRVMREILVYEGQTSYLNNIMSLK